MVVPGSKQVEEQAKAEIKEEINGRISGITNLGIMHSNTGLEFSTTHLFSAEIESFNEVEEEEGIKEIELLTNLKFIDLMNKGLIKDSFTLSTFVKLINS